jgi:HD-GYP domain-containing protein (c-di-GMP phosphodiesterase class II)
VPPEVTYGSIHHVRCAPYLYNGGYTVLSMLPEMAGGAVLARAVDSGVRLAELMAALSMATDLGMGQPLETALCSCVVATRLGEALHLDDGTLRDVYYYALLRYIGCNADTYLLAAVVGDELALRRDFAAIDPGEPPAVVDLVVRYIRQAHASASPSRLDETVARSLLSLPRLTQESFAGHCEVAQRLAGRLGLADSLVVCLGQLYERWDGKGLPRGLAGEEVAPVALLVTLAQDAVVWMRLGSREAAVAMVRQRSGGAYHPQMAQRFCADASTILAGLDQEPTWESVLALEPGEHASLSDEAFDRACAALADFADIKSPYLLGHSPGVAALAAGAGRRQGLVESDVRALRCAGLLHDIGRVGISAGIWGKAGALSEREWEQVRLHAYYTDRVLARPAALGRLGALASQHHERLDGSGYHRGLSGQAIAPAARILAAADAYQAMSEARPHRPALPAEQAAAELRREARAGRLDGEAVHAVLAEAGHRVPPVRRERPAGLSRREVEVLRLLARGHANREMAGQLCVSPDTIKHHIQHIYNKTGLATRAGVTLFAMEHGLL